MEFLTIFQLNVAVHTLMGISYFFLQSDDLTKVSKPTSLQTVREDSDVMNEDGPTLDRPLTSLEKLHIIVSYGIIRRDLRLIMVHFEVMYFCCKFPG